MVGTVNKELNFALPVTVRYSTIVLDDADANSSASIHELVGLLTFGKKHRERKLFDIILIVFIQRKPAWTKLQVSAIRS